MINVKLGLLIQDGVFCLPSPIPPISISPNLSSHFALCRLAPYPFRPLPFCPFANSPNHLFAHLPFRPFVSSPFADSPNATSPLYHFALHDSVQCHFAHLSSRPFINLSFCFSFTETADYSTQFPGIGAQTVTWYRERIKRILVYSFLGKLEL